MKIFDIKRYAIHDGPGIRTTLFLKGCPLRCVWCHNPESWSSQPQKTYKQSKCIGCGSCIEACPVGAIKLTSEGIIPTTQIHSAPLANREGLGESPICLQCGKCAEACPTMALEMCGREWTIEEIMKEVEKEREVMTDSGGGVTLCGGEPLMQDIVPLLRELGKRGFHRTVDTTLYASPERVCEVARECELFLVDIKLMDSEKHRRFTGVPNDGILANIRLLAELGAPFIVRIPLIEGVNADDENIKQTIEFLLSLNRLNEAETQTSISLQPHNLTTLQPYNLKTSKPQVELLPYHDVGRDKHRRLWSKYNPDNLPMGTPTDAQIEHICQLFHEVGITAMLG